jgi:mono/diheme cytochrome c family protein
MRSAQRLFGRKLGASAQVDPPSTARLHRAQEGSTHARAALVVVMMVMLLVVACTRGSISKHPPIHLNPNMDQQPKAMPEASSDFFADGKTMRPKLAGTVAREDAVDDGGLSTGKDAAGNFLTQFPMQVDDALLTRGRQRYAIYCEPCHGEKADGNGMLHQRANVRVANLHDPRIVAMPPGQIIDVIDNGLGLMPSYRYPIPPHDRWAIVAYVEKLQREQAKGQTPETAASPEAPSPQPQAEGRAG